MLVLQPTHWQLVLAQLTGPKYPQNKGLIPDRIWVLVQCGEKLRMPDQCQAQPLGISAPKRPAHIRGKGLTHRLKAKELRQLLTSVLASPLPVASLAATIAPRLNRCLAHLASGVRLAFTFTTNPSAVAARCARSVTTTHTACLVVITNTLQAHDSLIRSRTRKLADELAAYAAALRLWPAPFLCHLQPSLHSPRRPQMRPSLTPSSWSRTAWPPTKATLLP